MVEKYGSVNLYGRELSVLEHGYVRDRMLDVTLRGPCQAKLDFFPLGHMAVRHSEYNASFDISRNRSRVSSSIQKIPWEKHGLHADSFVDLGPLL